MKKLFPLVCFSLLLFSCHKSNNTSTNIYNLPNDYSNRSVGASAKDLLRDTTYGSLNVEVQYMPGVKPDSQAVLSMKNFLSTYCNKPNGINFVFEPLPTQNKTTMSLNDVMLFEKQNRKYYTSTFNVWLYVLVTDGYSDSSGTLGIAYRNTSICLYGGNILANSGNFGQIDRATLEATVMDHELGHLMGLVNLGTPMVTDHQDVAHGNHCTNPHCLMYYQAETNFTIGGLLSGAPTQLDSNCIADLDSNGAK